MKLSQGNVLCLSFAFRVAKLKRKWQKLKRQNQQVGGAFAVEKASGLVWSRPSDTLNNNKASLNQ